MAAPIATVFVSYSHANKPLAREVADGLTSRGYRVWIDEGELRAGDSILQVIAAAIGQVDFVVAFVSPASVASAWCQKELALAMTDEINQVGVTVIPVRIDDVEMPASLKDKLYVDASTLQAEELVDRLDQDMRRQLQPADPMPPRRRAAAPSRPRSNPPQAGAAGPAPSIAIRVIGIDADGITRPRNDGTQGSALYRIPVLLSQRPDPLWANLMVHNWDRPPQWTSRHRPGIGRVEADRFILDGTTIEEVDKYHLATLKLAVDQTNDQYRAHLAQVHAEQERTAQAHSAQDAAVQAALESMRHRFGD